jgi:hypothetical protein
VIGMETDVDVLSDVAGAKEHVLLDAIDAGLLTGLVTEPGPGRIRFAHALVRDTLYQSLSRLRRSRLHDRAGQAIQRRHPGEVAALAYHFAEAATNPARAARYCALAAGQAEQRFAYHEAARLWEQAIACLDRAAASAALPWTTRRCSPGSSPHSTSPSCGPRTTTPPPTRGPSRGSSAISPATSACPAPAPTTGTRSPWPGRRERTCGARPPSGALARPRGCP